MKYTHHIPEPCDGTIPDGWEMPEIQNRLSFHQGYVSIDFCGTTPPTPLVGTLKALAKLKEGEYLLSRYPRSPIHLFPHLVEDGWSYETLEQDEKGCLLKIYKKDDQS